MSTHRFRRLSIALVGIFSLTCSELAWDPEPWTVGDLASDLPFARLAVEMAELDFGAQGSSVWLDAGWSHIEESGDQTTFRWAIGKRSSLHFDLVSRRDLDLELIARPFRFREAKTQHVEVLFNGTSVGSFEMRPRWYAYRVAIPSGLQRLGDNTLDFVYRHARSLEDSDNKSARRYAVAWRRLALSEARVALDSPAALREMSALFVPAGNRLEYHLEIPRDSSLQVDRILPRGDRAGRLLIETATDERGETLLVEQRGASTPLDELLLSGEGGVLRLSITVDPGGPVSAGSGYILEQPRVVSSSEEGSPKPAPSADPGVLPRSQQPNILVYLVDTLRTDAVGAYGAEWPMSPEFDRFAESATLFANAVGQSSWTRASVGSLFTGLWPYRHGAVGRLDILPEEAETLPELLQEAGYHNAAFITNPNVSGKFGFAQGFEEFTHIRTHRASDEVNQRVFHWLTERQDSRPFFLYVHTMDPHHPYLPPEPMRPDFARTESEMRAINRLLKVTPQPRGLRSQRDRFRALYDGAAQFNDRSFGELLQFLETSDLLNSTVVLFLSDHGEEFLEHGHWQHGKNLHAETLNVPLAVRFPDIGHGQRVTTLAGHVDILPTFLDYLRLPDMPGLDGETLMPLLAGEGSLRTDAGDLGRAFSHLSLDGHESVAVIDGEWKLILARSKREVPSRSLFRWTTDPGEQKDLAAERPVLARYLETLIARKIATDPPSLSTTEAELDSELERSLRALGYLR